MGINIVQYTYIIDYEAIKNDIEQNVLFVKRFSDILSKKSMV